MEVLIVSMEVLIVCAVMIAILYGLSAIVNIRIRKERSDRPQSEKAPSVEDSTGSSPLPEESEPYNAVPVKTTMFDKGILSHFPDVSPNETPKCYCIAKIYPRSQAKNSDYWFLITDRYIRAKRRANTINGILSQDDQLCIKTKDFQIQEEKHNGIQFYPVEEAPVEHKANIPFFIHGMGAVGGLMGSAIHSAINIGRSAGLVLYFKDEDYYTICSFFEKEWDSLEDFEEDSEEVNGVTENSNATETISNGTPNDAQLGDIEKELLVICGKLDMKRKTALLTKAYELLEEMT